MSLSTSLSPTPSETSAAQRPPLERATVIILGVAAAQILILIIQNSG